MNELEKILGLTLEQLLVAGVVIAFFVLFGVWRYLRLQADSERCLDMVFWKIKIPKKDSKDDRESEGDKFSASKDFKEVLGVMAHLFESLFSVYNKEYTGWLKGQDFFSFEYALIGGLVEFYVVAPKHLGDLLERQITSYYPDAVLEQVDDYNIFYPGYKVAASYQRLDKHYMYPIRTYQRINSDPLNTFINAFTNMEENEGAAIQIMVRPIKNGWQEKGLQTAQDLYNSKKTDFAWYNPITWIRGLFEMIVTKPDDMFNKTQEAQNRVTPAADDAIKAFDEKNSKVGFETIIRCVTSATTQHRAQKILGIVRASFDQFDYQFNNALTYTKWHWNNRLIHNFIFRKFKLPFSLWIRRKKMILGAEELASMFHFPLIRFNKTPIISWQNYKIAPAPSNIPKDGLLLGHNEYRGKKLPVYMKNEDRFRHFYVIGQTGTGKSSILQVMIRQDLQEGRGVCVVDPHGSLIEDIMPFIPRERADDVIYFNPADMDRPMGINLLEAATPEEQDYVALEAMNMMIKLFNEEIFGPRIQDYFRNGVLTLMADPEGGALTDIVRLFTDDDFQKFKVEKVQNPIVRSFWLDQMAKTGAREKAEMIPYFAAKFGGFVTNAMMRNIIGQSKSAFDFLDVMQNKKILLMNLSKGTVGELNSKLLGMIIVSKIQMAALKREQIPKEQRSDFFLYIDEFQNYITDSIEVILSEARKYRLGLIIAHQFLGQLEGDNNAMKKGSSKVKDAVFGNVGSIMSYKIGAQDAEFMAKEFAPVFSDQDLINMDKYKGVMKLSIDTQPSRPFSIVPTNPYLEKGDRDAAEAFKQLARLKYGRDREYVEREILRRMGVIGSGMTPPPSVPALPDGF